MTKVAEEPLPIDLRLQPAPFGLERVSDAPFAGAEYERVFRDAADDQVSAKQYTSFRSPRLAVTGRVDEYEPDTLWLRVEGSGHSGAALLRVIESAGFAEFRRRRLLTEQRPAEPGAAPRHGA